jgi:hypothetical protein
MRTKTLLRDYSLIGPRIRVRVESGTTPPPKLSKEEQGELIKRAVELAPKYRTELLLA